MVKRKYIKRLLFITDCKYYFIMISYQYYHNRVYNHRIYKYLIHFNRWKWIYGNSYLNKIATVVFLSQSAAASKKFFCIFFLIYTKKKELLNKHASKLLYIIKIKIILKIMQRNSAKYCFNMSTCTDSFYFDSPSTPDSSTIIQMT